MEICVTSIVGDRDIVPQQGAFPQGAAQPELVLQIGHQRTAENASIVGAVFSPSGRWVASVGGPAFESGEVKIWSAQSGALWRTLPAGAEMSQVIFSPDSQNVMAVGRGGAWLWRVRDGARLRFWSNTAIPNGGIAFSPNGHTLFSVGNSHALARDWRSNRVLWSLPDTYSTQLALSPDGKLLSMSGINNTLQVRDPVTGQLIRNLEPEARDVNDHLEALAFSPNSTLVASASRKRLRVWDVATGRLLQSWKGHEGEDCTLAFSSEGRLISAGSDGLLRWWEPRTRRLTHTVRWSQKFVFSLAPSPDGQRLAVVDFDNLRLWDDKGARFTWHAPRGAWPLGGAAMSPDGRTLAVPSQDDTLRLWDVRKGHLRQTLHETRGLEGSAAYSPDGKLLANVGFEFLSLWDVASKKRLRALTGGAASLPPAFSPNNRLLAFGDSQGGPVWVWNAQDGRLLWKHEGQGPVAFGEGGRVLIGEGHWGDRIEVWNAHTGKLLRTLTDVPVQANGTRRIQSHGVSLKAIAPGAKVLACEVPLPQPTQPDSESAERAVSLQLWSADGQIRRTLATLPPSWPVAFTPDGKLLAVYDRGKIRLWETASARERADIATREGMLKGLTFSPDSRSLMCAWQDGRVTVTRIRDGKHQATLMILPPRNVNDFGDYAASDWIAWTPNGFYSASQGARDFMRWRVGDMLFPASHFERRFHRPEVVSHALTTP